MNQFLPVGPQSFFIIQLHYHYNVANYQLLNDVVTCCDVPAVSVPQHNYGGTREFIARNFRGPSQAACLNCACVLLVLLGKGQTSTPAQSISSHFCSFFVCMCTHSSSLLFAVSLITYTIPAIFTGYIAEKIIWFPFWQNIILV